ncbi:DEAD/DEAH box helicase [Priestia megaterium]|uniref:DEAD/DEAH box helicase n=1 Tax=Priestia megaterium TaxID=1404 RepID=UPI002E1FF7C5|nr:helicase-related protein [Priestia megaterium]
MLLDLKNNELIFSEVGDMASFRDDLRSNKDVKFREYLQKFYVSLADFDAIRSVLSKKHKGGINFTDTYQRFANKFVLSQGDVKIIWNTTVCEIEGPNIPWHEIIPKTSYFNKAAKRSRTYGKSWSGYVHLFNPIKGEFPSGLLERVIQALTKNGTSFTIDQTFSYPKPYFHLSPSFSFEPTTDQINSVAALEKSNTGIAKLPTGFGKTSYVAASLIQKKGVRSLFLANQKILTNDARKDFEAVFAGNDISLGFIGDGVFEPGDITVASIQTIAASLKEPNEKERELAEYQIGLAEQRLKLARDDEQKKEAKKEIKKHTARLRGIDARIERHKRVIPFLKEVDLFIVDEAQVLGTEQWNSFLHACPAPYRYTLSATPTRTDGGGIQIIAATGEMRFESFASEQIEKGRLAEFTGHFRKFDHKMEKDVVKDLNIEYHQAYDIFIVHNEKRNDHLCDKVIEWARDYYVLALVTRKAHGEIVKKMLIEKGMNEEDVHYIDGDTNEKKREKIITSFRNCEFPVLIGTSVFDVGFNVKNASKMVRFNAGSSEVREPQRAGRTVRKRLDDTVGETYDMIDTNCPYFESQAWKRLSLLREEFGSERVKFHSGIIEGELNVIGLQEIVSSIPEKTDRAKGEEIIKTLQYVNDDFEEEEDDTEDYNLDDLSPNLKRILDQLTVK